MGRQSGGPTEEAGDFFDVARVELGRAARKHGRFNSLHEGYAVLLEEVEELWEEIKRRDPRPAEIYKEAVQIAAMAGRIDRDCLR